MVQTLIWQTSRYACLLLEHCCLSPRVTIECWVALPVVQQPHVTPQAAVFLQQGEAPFLPYSEQQIQAAALTAVGNLKVQIKEAQLEAAELEQTLRVLLYKLELTSEFARSMAKMRLQWPPQQQATMLEMDQRQTVATAAQVERAQAAYDLQLAFIKQLQCNQTHLQQFV